MSAPDPRKDPRYRSFRAAAYGVHIALSAVFCVWIIVNVGRSVAGMTPGRQPAAPLISYRECLDEARTLWNELESAREALVRTQSTRRDGDQEWMRLRTAWLERLRANEARCGLQSRDRAPLLAVYQRLEHVLDLYTLHAVQYADKVGGGVESLRSAFEAARKHPGAGKLP